MPFPHQGSRPFSRRGIEVLSWDQNGLYGIFNSIACIYVGRGNIRAQLLAHLNGIGGNPCILRNHPTHYVVELASNGCGRQRQLIAEFDPVCNRTGRGSRRTTLVMTR
jgi:hypothetical protein